MYIRHLTGPPVPINLILRRGLVSCHPQTPPALQSSVQYRGGYTHEIPDRAPINGRLLVQQSAFRQYVDPHRWEGQETTYRPVPLSAEKRSPVVFIFPLTAIPLPRTAWPPSRHNKRTRLSSRCLRSISNEEFRGGAIFVPTRA